MRLLKLAAASAAAGVVTLAAAAGLIFPAAASAASGNATVTIVHGIPNTPVDVYANGNKIISGFTFKTVTQPLSLPAGSYTVDVRKAGAAAASAPILTATEQVPAGANLTLVADLTASGTPALTPFVNDTSPVAAGDGRLVVRHTAAAPAVDVYAATAKAISGLTNGQQQALTVPAGTVAAKVTLAGQTAAVLGPVNVPVTAGMATVVYAIGSASGHTLTAVTQQYPLGGMPRSAHSGSGGLGADGATPTWPFGLAAIAGLTLAGAGLAGVARRRRSW
jgi:Domain of unknown function (DUF4397)